MSGKRIVLTSDATMMSNYNGGVMLGFAAILPASIISERIFKWLFCPPVEAGPDGSAILAPCGMRKVEAALLEAGFSRDEVMVAHPDHLDEAIGPDTEIVGITHDDPMGKIAVREIEEMINRGAPYNRTKFLELVGHPLIKEHKPKVVIGGNGSWELRGEDVGVDLIYLGEGERTFPEVCRKIVAGEDVGGEIEGETVPGDEIPVNRGATVGGIVEIGRGCWRGCSFCSPTMRKPRHRPISKILKDAEVNIKAGQKDIILHSEDAFQYGSAGSEPNRELLLDLFRRVKELGPRTVDVSHMSLASVYHNQDLLEQISDIVGIGTDQRYMSAWIGIETGSPTLLAKHMKNKTKPAPLEIWPEIVRECYSLFKDRSWLPVASLVLGLPGETEEDVVLTTELVESLKESVGLMLPLFFTPIGETRLGNARGFGKDRAKPEHWELVGTCLEYNLRHLKALHRYYSERMTAGVGQHLALRGINLLSDYALKKYLRRMKRGEPPN
ncbi:MAG TPA: radical SAM protein [Methanothrix sp.]|nr:radical SAM protein [Methanothrix sp.]